MASKSIRILFLSDTHLGFDLPFRPRIKRNRRGPNFFNNLDIALSFAVEHRVDCAVHDRTAIETFCVIHLFMLWIVHQQNFNTSFEIDCIRNVSMLFGLHGCYNDRMVPC